MRINNNALAINAYRNLSSTNTQLGKSLEKLSSGYRINRAADDAAGLVISQNLRAQISGLKQATRNAQDGISVVQTAEGALNEVHTMLERMRTLAVQSANTGSNDPTAQAAAQSEISELKSEIDRISGSTEFGGVKLLDGSYGTKAASVSGYDADNAITWTAGDDFDINVNGTGAVTVNLTGTGGTGAQAAASIQNAIKSALLGGTAAQAAFADNVKVTAESVGQSGTSLTIEIDGLTNGQTFALTDGTNTPLAAMGFGAVTAASGTGGTFQIGANSSDTLNVSIAAVDTAALGISGVDVTVNPSQAIDDLQAAIETVSSVRGNLGAKQNRFESIINNLQVTTENLTASESRIRDTDMASEMTSFTRNQILSQAGTAMLAQANQVPQTVLSLLR